MKKLLFIIPLLIISCQKKEISTQNSAKTDSLSSAESASSNVDATTNGILETAPQEPTETHQTFRAVVGDSIIKTINADMIPLKIEDEFTNDGQKLYIKIKNFKAKKIVGKVQPKNSDMNIRFNQIKYPDGTYDGPFGADLSAEIKSPGEVWLIIGKNLMASGKLTGKFTVTLK